MSWAQFYTKGWPLAKRWHLASRIMLGKPVRVESSCGHPAGEFCEKCEVLRNLQWSTA